MSSSSSNGVWDSQSNLLLLQLIYKYGDPFTSTTPEEKSAVFNQIANQLSTHALIRPSKRKFTAITCEEHYIELLSQASLTREVSLPTSASAHKKRIVLRVRKLNEASKSVAQLAQKLYITHLTQLKSEIKALEEEFLTTTKEIEAIDRGDWDEKFQKQIVEQNDGADGVENGVKRGRGGRKQGEEDGEQAEEGEEPPAKRSKTEELVETKEELVEERVEGAAEVVEEPVDHPMEDVTGTENVEEPEETEEKVEPIQVDEEQEPQTTEKEVSEEPQPEPSPLSPSAPEEKGAIDLDEGEETEEEQTIKTSPTKPDLSDQESDAEHTPTRPKKSFPILIQPLHASLSSLKSATLFSNPIREHDAPGYSTLIKKPMDLKTLWRLVKDGTITDSKTYHREVMRMFANAIMYNAEHCMSPLFVRAGGGLIVVAAVGEMSRDMAREGDKLCEGYRKSENFGTEGTRRKRK